MYVQTGYDIRMITISTPTVPTVGVNIYHLVFVTKETKPSGMNCEVQRKISKKLCQNVGQVFLYRKLRSFSVYLTPNQYKQTDRHLEIVCQRLGLRSLQKW